MMEGIFLILKKKWFICSLVFLFALSLSVVHVLGKEASAKLNYSIVVKIKGEKSVDKKDVEIEVTGESLGTQIKTTNKKGIVEIKKLAKGTYTVAPTKEGYTFDPKSREITFTKGRRVSTSFTMVVTPVGVTPISSEEALTVSKPSNGTHFVKGEKPIITITLPDELNPSDYSQLRLVVYGPQETTKTVTAVKLLNASTDRSASNTGPHHYIDLITDTNVQVNDNILTYKLQPISDEEAGTYTASLWAVLKDNPSMQSFPLVDFQIGTATSEKQIFEMEKCSVCHLGADSRKYYFHHIDPRTSGSSGYPSIDSWAVRTCKTCHNTDGYAAYTDPANPSATDGSNKIPDPIVKRVHGVHMGEGLKNSLNTDATTGIFKNYTHVVFPADVRNCTMCHMDDRWKTTPSRLACRACHDNIWFGDTASMPTTAEAHPGGQQDNDSGCSFCHPAPTISTVHKVAPPAFQNTVELSMTPPARGTHYVAGEKPRVTITIKDTNGNIIEPATIVEPANSASVQANEWKRANFYVSGPRVNTRPVLTKAAKDNKFAYYANNDLRVRIKPENEDPNVTRSATGITYQLDDVTGLKSGTYTAFVEILPASGMGGWAFINFQVNTDKEEKKVATNCTDCHGDTTMHSSFFAVKFDPDICKNCHDYNRAGTGYGWAGAPPTGTNGTSTSGWSGFGAKPLAARIHGVHRGRYLEYPEEVKPLYRLVGGSPVYTPDYDFSEVIFPQDIRNCTKCHSADTTGTWKTEPSRLVCLACHDSDGANTHGTLMTYDETPTDPWSGDEVETCEVCHGSGRDYAPDKMHNISSPYKPPYLREPAE